MAIKSEDIVPLNQVRARFTELAEEVRAGAEKIITKNGESYVGALRSQNARCASGLDDRGFWILPLVWHRKQV